VSAVRTRFAPSPTGYFHIGGARTALFSWLYARQHGGQFVLRIEDTDAERNTEEAVQIILEGMAWLGLDSDEAPVYQSHNLANHTAEAQKLLESGAAYRCYADRDEIAAVRDAAKAKGIPSWKYTGPDSVISLDEQVKREAAGAPFVVRFRVPREAGPVCFTDLVYGEQAIDPDELDDFVLLRNDGSPLYMLSVVCDDAAAGITHVVRGQDHLSNTPKQILLYQAMGKPVPTFAHLPLIMAAGGEKMSKRKHGDVVSITTYRDKGFVPDALLNFLALLGWSPQDPADEGREMFTKQELIERFDLARVNRANAKFSFDQHDERKWTDPKAQSINATWIRTMPLDELLPMVEQKMRAAGLWQDEFAGPRADWFRSTMELIRERFWTLNDFVEQGSAYYSDTILWDDKAVAKNLHKVPELAQALPALADALEQLDAFEHDPIEEQARLVADAHGLGHGKVINGLRTAVTGQAVGPGAFELCIAIGRERVCRRLRDAARIVES